MSELIIEEKLKWLLIRLLISHSRLNQAEYERNPSYNTQHISYKVEQEIIEYLSEQETDILDIIFNFPTTDKEIDECLKKVNPDDLKVDFSKEIISKIKSNTKPKREIEIAEFGLGSRLMYPYCKIADLRKFGLGFACLCDNKCCYRETAKWTMKVD